MFDNLKNMYNLRQQAQEMQRVLAGEQVTGNSRDGSFRVTMNGNQEVLNVEVRDESKLSKELIEQNSREAFRDALERVKKLMAEKFKGMM